MSFEKINNILENDQMIGVNLISDSLKTALNEMIDMIMNQDKKIKILEQKISEKAAISDVQVINETLENFNTASVQLMIKKSENEIKESLAKNAKLIKETETKLDQAFNEKIWTLSAENKKEFEKISQDFEIQRQRCNNLSSELKSVDEKAITSEQKISKIEEKIIELDEKSDETIVEKLKSLEEFTKSIKENVDSNNSAITNEANEINQKIERTNSENRKLIAKIDDKLIEFNARLMESESLTSNPSEPLDSSAILRAIQRNSRRIDNLSGIVLKTQKECEQGSQFFSGVHQCLTDIGYVVTMLVTNINTLKNKLHEYLKSQIGNFAEMSKITYELTGRFKESQDVLAESLRDINDTITSIQAATKSRLTNVSTNVVPNAIEYCVKASDELEKILENEPRENLFTDNPLFKEIEVPNILIPVLPTDKSVEKEEIKVDARKNEAEIREKLALLTNAFNKEAEDNREFKTKVNGELDKKADTFVVERLVDKIKSMMNTMQIKIAEINKTQVRHPETHDSDSSQNKCFSKGIPMPRSAFSRTLPPLPTSAQAYDIMYKK